MSERGVRGCLVAPWLALWLAILGCGHYGPPTRGPADASNAGAPALVDPTCTEEEEKP
ncbi:MAG: hypothetical protein HRU00_09255 [Myxococcales bacterium]|nr:hypothetical protein [Myxococcales bacterium]